MAVFDFPRIHVAGRYLVSPGTANNGHRTSDTERVRAMTGSMSDAQFRQWVGSADPTGHLRAEWNYYGDNTVRFLDVTVRSVEVDYGDLVSDSGLDPLVGAGVYLTDALICDANPEGIDTSQIFASSLQVISPAALVEGTFVSRRPGRATTRAINFNRNLSFRGCLGDDTTSNDGAGSACFQMSIPVQSTDLRPQPREDSAAAQALHRLIPRPESPGASALVAALDEPGTRGLVFRFCLYLTYPFIADSVLEAAFARGEHPDNPAIGLVTGTIAPWYGGEPTSLTVGRRLVPATSYTNPYRDGPFFLAPAVARVDEHNRYVSIDLSNTMPEDGPEGEKWNFGTVTLGVRTATTPGTDPAQNDAAVTVIGAVENDRATYVLRAGIYDVALGPQLGADVTTLLNDPGNELVVQTELDGVLLYEPEYMVASDCGCSYLDELAPGQTWDDPDVVDWLARQPDDALTGFVPLVVRRRGEVVSSETAITVEEWRLTPASYPGDPGADRMPRLVRTEQVVVPAGADIYEYRLRPSPGPGARDFRLVAPGQWPAQVDGTGFYSWVSAHGCTALRVLPYDDYSKVDEVTFDFIYNEVLRYYALIFPAMSLRLDLSDPTLWETPAAAHYLERVTQLELWATTLYMPRTRDLSRPRRDLLHRFCRQVIGAFAQRSSLQDPSDATSSPPPEPDAPTELWSAPTS